MMNDHLRTSESVCETLLDVLSLRARAAPERSAYFFLNRDGEVACAWSYGELLSIAGAISSGLLKRVRRGDRVILSFNPGLEFIGAYFGCLLAGAIPVPTHTPRARKVGGELAAIVADSEAALAVTDGDLMARLHTATAGRLPILAFDELVQEGGASDAPRVGTQDLALLQYTSGSTGRPKGVMVTHAHLLANSRAIHAAFEHSEASRGVIWLPAYHDMGLIGGVIQPLFGGFPVWLMSPYDFLQRPSRWLRAVSQYRATTSGGPNFAYQACLDRVKDEDLEGVDLSSWRVAFNGAEAVRRGTMRAFAARFAAHGFQADSLLPCYGLAESTLMVTCAARGRARANLTVGDDAGVLGSGSAVPGTDVVVVSSERRELCKPGEAGEILVRGPSIALGYWRNPEATQNSFGAYVPTLGGGFLRTGDSGRFEAGELLVTGRLKDVVILGGRNYAAEDLEASVADCHDGVRACASAVFGADDGQVERLVIIQEVSRTSVRDAAALGAVDLAVREAVSSSHGLAVHAVVLVPQGTIPRTTSGKVRRARCRELWLRGEVESLRERARPSSMLAQEQAS